MKMVTKKCKYCGNEFERPKGNAARQKHCSHKCANYSRYGDPYHRMMKHVTHKADTECWEFDGCRDGFGYGKVSVNGKQKRTHRLAWEHAWGEIPKGKCVLHKCDNPCCVNPDHLFIGSQRDNIKDMDSKGRRKNQFSE
jgi:hypothetical protein